MTTDPDAEYDGFEWDESKRASNLQKHGIDFQDVASAMSGPHVVSHAHAAGETRWIAILPVGERMAAVIFTLRDRRCRIISARIARKNEREAYHAHFER